ncbi:arsenate reductase/protein-tyrosine-phosphatase family protein [Rugosimonospora africana]|uniref:protein-tyrosine-phosphatase n=1 Tax=Rugosimonospora africana TaxID=556532 RepID=A0A8J3VWP2_9ACTN|nr:low molecular weight phosphatase family protein [Rugosimonospora africana]GIH20998.1 protein-tyrosine-phosphatase [Rugosimonospora africana]
MPVRLPTSPWSYTPPRERIFQPVAEGVAPMASGILFVCYANMCRSPMAEYIARDMLTRRLGADRAPVPVSSAGTNAMPGYRMHPHAATVAAGLGADPAPFRSRPLTADTIAQAGLVLAATQRERAVCLSLVPAALHRTFTLRQFSRLAAAAGDQSASSGPDDARPDAGRDGVPDAARDRGQDAARDVGQDAARRLAAAVAAAVRARGQLQPVEPGDDDLADPVGQPVAAFHQCAGQIEAALEPVVALIASCG